MPEESFAYGSGFAASPPLTNIESAVSDPPFVEPEDLVPLLIGDIRRQMADRSIQVNGVSLIFWRWEYMSQADLNALILALFGDFATGSAQMTIFTLTEQGVYASFNATVERPRPGEHYDQSEYGWIQNLAMPIYVESTQGAFTSGFTEGFEV